MTRLEAIKARVRVRPGPGWAGWVYHADDDRRWLLERLDELAKFCREHMELHGGYWHRTISEALAKLGDA